MILLCPIVRCHCLELIGSTLTSCNMMSLSLDFDIIRSSQVNLSTTGSNSLVSLTNELNLGEEDEDMGREKGRGQWSNENDASSKDNAKQRGW